MVWVIKLQFSKDYEMELLKNISECQLFGRQSPCPSLRSWFSEERHSQEAKQPDVAAIVMCLLFATPWTAVLQATLSLISSQSLPKFMSVTLSNHLILWCPLLFFPSIFLSLRGFSNKLALWFASGGLSIGDSASASVLPMSIQSWFLLGLPGLSPCYPWDSRVFSSTTISQITSYN